MLGTSAAQPTVRRGLSATSVRTHRDHFLIDCGEGTQRQLLRFGVGYDIDFVLFTHLHADHYLGIAGFLRTMAMGARRAPLELYGPVPLAEDELPALLELERGELCFAARYRALADGDLLERDGYSIRAVAVEHRAPALGYVLEEPRRPGEFLVGRARELGVPEGPLFGHLQAGEAVTLADGRTIVPGDVMGPARRGRKVVFSGDTRPCGALERAAAGADLLVHDSTFSTANHARAVQTGHSTAAEAAALAARAGVRELILTHLSSRPESAPERLAEEARAVFSGPIAVAEDGLVREVSLPD